jgi:hypothetical protein
MQFLGLLDTTVGTAGGETGFRGRHALVCKFVLEQGQMRVHLASHLALGAPRRYHIH